MADEQQRAAAGQAGQQLESVTSLKVPAQRLVLDGLQAELRAGQARRVKRADPGTCKGVNELDAEARERPSRAASLAFTAGRQPACEVRSSAILRFAMAQQPERLGHRFRLPIP